DSLQIRVLRADRWVIESGGDRVGRGDLSELVLQHHRARAVQHPESSAGETRRMLAERMPLPSGFDSDETNRIVFQHLVEQADRIRSATDARDCDIGQRSGSLLQLA